MTRIEGPIDVTPPEDEARRDRIERGLFERLDAEAASATGSMPASTPPAWRPATWWRPAVALSGVALGVTALLLILSARQSPAPRATRLTLAGAIVDVDPGSEARVEPGEDGAVTVVLARGAIEYDVEPRAGRAPFRVIAGDTTVEVIGTRFRVVHRDRVQVSVARGKVRVLAAGGERLLGPGES